jgi:hypothetical protein
MNITNNGFNADNRTVSATFSHEGVTHTRDVNACLDEVGGYDEEATAARLEEVGAGVAAKIGAGAVTNPPAIEEEPAGEPKPRRGKKVVSADTQA